MFRNFFPLILNFFYFNNKLFVCKLTKSVNVGLCKYNYRSPELVNYFHFITGRSGRFKRLIWTFVPAARKLYVSEQGFLFIKLSFQSPLQALEVCNRNFRIPCIGKCLFYPIDETIIWSSRTNKLHQNLRLLLGLKCLCRERLRFHSAFTIQACRGDWVDNFLSRNSCPETYHFRAAGPTISN